MAHVKPHWKQPSHPDIQDVQYGKEGFTTKSFSKVSLPPFGLFAKLSFPPCDTADEPTYATVQYGKNKHLNLNSDMLYINHSCEPSLIFDMGNLIITAGPKGLEKGEELSFFYPSTEWDMRQSFDCLCGKPTCRGRISGAKDMPQEKLDGLWITKHIRDMLEERVASEAGDTAVASTPENEVPSPSDPTAAALRDALKHAEKAVEAARRALDAYPTSKEAHIYRMNGKEHGITSRELAGEMGGDTNGAK